jgi:hypothetical protein
VEGARRSGRGSWDDLCIEFDHDNATVRLDWHGYAIDQVDTWADRVVESAWKHGYDYVEFIHGAGDVSAPGTLGHGGDPRLRKPRGRPEGRGQVKDMLRKRLYGKRWSKWVAERRQGLHVVNEGSMRISLKPNPEPDPTAKWPLVPPPAHG